MKKRFQVILCSLLITIGMCACSKKNDNAPSSAASSWSFGGATYAAGTTVFTSNSLLSVAKANSQETLSINFNKTPSAGTYTVVAGSPGNNQCVIQATSLGNNAALLSQGGGSVTVTSANGKIHAVFSGIPMVTVTSTSAGALSGDLTEQ